MGARAQDDDAEAEETDSAASDGSEEASLRSPYQPFSGRSALCPKCGDVLACEYRESGTAFHISSVIWYSKGSPEWLLRKCVDCGYRRPEMCADAYPETAFDVRYGKS